VKARPPKNATPAEAAAPDWDLWLYVAGPTLKSAAVFRNLKQICEEHLAGRYRIKVIDLMKNPQIARDDQIVALPAVIRKQPLPMRKIIGDMSNTERVLAGLDLRPDAPSPFAARKE
jgi:circadian clock protein KaiB